MATALEASRRFREGAYQLGSARVRSRATGRLGPTPFRAQDASLPAFTAKFAQTLLEEPARRERARLEGEFIDLAREESAARLAQIRAATEKAKRVDPQEQMVEITPPQGSMVGDDPLKVPVSRAAAMVNALKVDEDTAAPTYPYTTAKSGTEVQLTGNQLAIREDAAAGGEDGDVPLGFNVSAPRQPGTQGPEELLVPADTQVSQEQRARLGIQYRGQLARGQQQEANRKQRAKLKADVKDTRRRYTAAREALNQITVRGEQETTAAVNKFRGAIDQWLQQAIKGDKARAIIAQADTSIVGERPDTGARPPGLVPSKGFLGLNPDDPAKIEARSILGLPKGFRLPPNQFNQKVYDAAIDRLVEKFAERKGIQFEKANAAKRAEFLRTIETEGTLLKDLEAEEAALRGQSSFTQDLIRNIEALP